MSITYINHLAEVLLERVGVLGGLKSFSPPEFRNREKRTEIRNDISLLDKILKLNNGFSKLFGS